MSDSSSMMIVLMMGMMASCVMSVFGGLGAWYLKDPTLGGLLEDLDPSDDDEDETGGGDGEETETNTTIPLDTKVYIHGILGKCDGENKYSYTLIHAANSTDVDAGCKRRDDIKDNYFWTIQSKKSGKWMYYTIKNVGQKKYLAPDGGALKLSDSEFLWRIKQQKSKDGHFSISSKDAIDSNKMMLNFWDNNCKKKPDNGGKDRRINLYKGSDFDNVPDNSQFRFRPAKSGWKGAVKNPC